MKVLARFYTQGKARVAKSVYLLRPQMVTVQLPPQQVPVTLFPCFYFLPFAPGVGSDSGSQPAGKKEGTGGSPGLEAPADKNPTHMTPGHLTLQSLDDFLPPGCPDSPFSVCRGMKE